MKEKSGYRRATGPVQYTKPKKQMITAEERKRQAQSLRTYKPNGDDIA